MTPPYLAAFAPPLTENKAPFAAWILVIEIRIVIFLFRTRRTSRPWPSPFPASAYAPVEFPALVRERISRHRRLGQNHAAPSAFPRLGGINPWGNVTDLGEISTAGQRRQTCVGWVDRRQGLSVLNDLFPHLGQIELRRASVRPDAPQPSSTDIAPRGP